jgi:hypothetical protein
LRLIAKHTLHAGIQIIGITIIVFVRHFICRPHTLLVVAKVVGNEKAVFCSPSLTQCRTVADGGVTLRSEVFHLSLQFRNLPRHSRIRRLQTIDGFFLLSLVGLGLLCLGSAATPLLFGLLLLWRDCLGVGGQARSLARRDAGHRSFFSSFHVEFLAEKKPRRLTPCEMRFSGRRFGLSMSETSIPHNVNHLSQVEFFTAELF